MTMTSLQASGFRFGRIAIPLVLVFACACSQDRTQSAVASATVVSRTGVQTPMAARFADFADTLHGVIVPDPLRWLEDTATTESRNWVGQQTLFTDSVLARLVLRDSIAAGLEKYYNAAPTLDDVVKTPGRVLLTRYMGSAPTLFALDNGASNEREVVSMETLARLGNGVGLRTFVPSWNGNLIALGTTTRGDENAAISIVDASNGKVLPDGAPDLLTTTSGTRYQVSWLPDNSGYFYPRLWPGVAASPADRLSRGRQFLHRLGTPQSSDIPVFGFGVTERVPMDADDLPTRIATAPGSQWMVASMFRSRRNSTDHYAAALVKGKEGVAEWTQIAGVDDLLSQLKLRGDTLYALSRKGADRGKLVRRVLKSGVTPGWETVMAERAGVLMELVVQDDAIYMSERAGGAINLLRLPYGSSTATPVKLPTNGAIHFARAQSGSGVTSAMDSWASPPHWLNATGETVKALGIDDGFDVAAASPVIATRLQAPSKDGTLVPVSVVYGDRALRNGKLDGTAPLLIETYGAFGVSNDPAFNPLVQYWVSIGGVYAYAHVRGGGELGEAWHTSAVRERKQNSIDDMIGAIEYLIANRYTSSKRVSMTGTSFGANIPGLVMVQRPDLIGAVLYEVGQPDEIRGSAMDPTAARNIAEIGDLETPEGIRMMMNASPYHRVPDKIALPAAIIHTASEDYNFGTQMLAAKYVARLQKANTGSSPVLWVQTDGGHRALFGVSPQWAATALSFVLWQTGVERFQPPN